MVLVEDAVAQVQTQCPFRVRLRALPSTTSTSRDTVGSPLRDPCLYFMADQKLCVRLEGGVAMCVFSTHTEPLKDYLENLYSVFTTMPAEAILLHRKMVKDATSDGGGTAYPSGSGRERSSADGGIGGGRLDSDEELREDSPRMDSPSPYRQRQGSHAEDGRHPPVTQDGSQVRVSRARRNTMKRVEDPYTMVRQRLVAASYRNGKRDFPNLFRHYDRNNNGDISVEEFVSLVRRDGKVSRSAMTDQELELMFVQDVDKDQSGTIEYAEFEAWILNESQPMSTANDRMATWTSCVRCSSALTVDTEE